MLRDEYKDKYKSRLVVIYKRPNGNVFRKIFGGSPEKLELEHERKDPIVGIVACPNDEYITYITDACVEINRTDRDLGLTDFEDLQNRVVFYRQKSGGTQELFFFRRYTSLSEKAENEKSLGIEEKDIVYESIGANIRYVDLASEMCNKLNKGLNPEKVNFNRLTIKI